MAKTEKMPLIVAVVSVLLVVLYLAEARNYPLRSEGQIGPGLYPVLVGVFLLVTTLKTVVDAWRERYKPDIHVEWPSGEGLWRVVAVVGATWFYIVLLPYLGDLIVDALTVLVILRVMGMRSWNRICPTAVLMAAAFHIMFPVLLQVPLPGGVLFQ
jgi:hypothetical protein